MIVKDTDVARRATDMAQRNFQLKAMGRAWSGIIDAIFLGQNRDERYRNGSFDYADITYKGSPWIFKFFKDSRQEPNDFRDVNVIDRRIMLHPQALGSMSIRDTAIVIPLGSHGMDVSAFNNAVEVTGYSHVELAELVLQGFAVTLMKSKD